MPQMPCEPPEDAISKLLLAEQAIRNGESLEILKLEELNAYWADLVRLLAAFKAHKNNDGEAIQDLQDCMTTRVYHTFLDGLHRRTLESAMGE